MRTALFLASLASMGASHKVDTLLITSDVTESTVLHAVGEYNYDGEAHGYPRYTCTERCIRNKILYRGSTGLWSITGSGQNVELNKGTIISNSKSSDTPVGLTFRYYSNGVWKQDKSFKVLDVTPVAIAANSKSPEQKAAAAVTTPPSVEKQPTTPPSRVQRKVDKKLDVIAKAAATESEGAAAAARADSSGVEAAGGAAAGGIGGLGSRSIWRRSAGMLAASSATWFLGVPTFKVALKALNVHREFRDQAALQAHEAYYQAAAPFQFINVQGGGGSSSSSGSGTGGFTEEPFLTTMMPGST